VLGRTNVDIKRLMALSAGQRNIDAAFVDLNEVIQNVLGTWVGECIRLHVETRISLGPTPLSVAGHRGQLQEVIDNLVRNALEAMSAVNDGARVLQVQAEHRDDTFSVVVQDSGPGFSENTLDKMRAQPRGAVLCVELPALGS
jgi:C4-dicarboxylate-specific signal transduction histidine kinase